MVGGEIGVIESRVQPGGGVVTGRTGGWELGRRVIRVRGVVVIRLVTGIAIRRHRGVVVVHVTTVTGNRNVRAGQRECGVVVIKVRAVPGRGVVAHFAGLRETRGFMVGIGGVVVIGEVAGHAGRVCQVVIVVDVALRALQRGMRSGQGETGGTVIENRPRPGNCAVAAVAGLRITQLRVVGIGGALIILEVAIHAGAAGQAVIVVDVTLRAVERGVRSGQRPSGGGVVEYRARPRSRVVALLASLRELGLSVTGIGRGLIIL